MGELTTVSELTTGRVEPLPEQRQRLSREIGLMIKAFEETNPDLTVSSIDIIRDGYYAGVHGHARVEVEIKVR